MPHKEEEKPSMHRYFFTNDKLSTGLASMLLLLLLASLLSYIAYGPYYSPDTANYFNFSASLFAEDTWKGLYSPFYPFLLYCLVSTSLSVFEAANWLILMQYGLGLFFLFQWLKIILGHFRLGQGKNTVMVLLILIAYHSWWSFRIVSWAHADASFYCLLIVWAYCLSRFHLEGTIKQLLILSLMSGLLIWLKLNALFLIPFYGLLLIFEKHKGKWLAPLLITIASFAGYQYFFRNQLLPLGQQEGFAIPSYLSGEKLEILSNNLAELFNATVGFIISDVASASIPFAIALSGGILILLSLLGLAVREVNKGLSLSSLFLLSGLVYLICLLAFQQMTGFEEINYRTLFPYYLGIGVYILFRLMRKGKFSRTVFLMALLITSHTLVGHLWLWNREEVNGLFEVERLGETELLKHIQTLHDGPFDQALFLSNHPEKLSLLLNDPYVAPYDPEFTFIHGKRRLIPSLERSRTLEATAEKLAIGEAVVVLFGKDKTLYQMVQGKHLMIETFPEGIILYKK